MPKIGWGWTTALVLLVLFIFKEALKTWSAAALEWIGRRAYARLAGSRVLRQPALRRYRRAVATKYGTLSVPFLEGRALDMRDIYVPLQSERGGPGADRGDAYARLRVARRCVVTGPPGSGKTMLLKHAVLTWAGGDRRGTVPVLVELHRCTGSTSSLEELIVARFARDDFPGADKYVSRALRNGGLHVLLDGLDEVSSADRSRVIQMIKDFVDTYQECQVTVTCRTAVYENQLAPELSVVLRVAEFDDRLIRRFLRRWPDMLSDGSVDQLISALRDAPRILGLARNPLLLTMIAYLYSGQSGKDEIKLPHSRAEFYAEATDVLLRRLHGQANRYPPQKKRAVLQRLALAAQDTPPSAADRLALPYATIVTQINSLLARLNLAAADADLLITEIVERSGLLLSIDGGERYQFAHLTLQEYLAATALAEDLEGLLKRYTTDSPTWREVVRLWCGVVSTDCAAVISALLENDQALAFECLADAQYINSDFAEKLTEDFVIMLQTGCDAEDEVVAAMGVVASDPRPRGQEFFHEVVRLALEDPSRRSTAIRTLAATNLPAAAGVLAQLGAQGEDALLSMGDLAVPILAARAEAGDEDAIDDLAEIGTPTAAGALASLIWRDGQASTRAAWQLSALIRDPDAREALGETSVHLGQRRFDWLWAPFGNGGSDRLGKVVGRIGWLVDNARQPPPDGLVIHRGIALGILAVRGVVRPGVVMQEQRWRYQYLLQMSGLNNSEFIRLRLRPDEWRRLREVPDLQLPRTLYYGLLVGAPFLISLVAFLRAIGSIGGPLPWVPMWLGWVAAGYLSACWAVLSCVEFISRRRSLHQIAASLLVISSDSRSGHQGLYGLFAPAVPLSIILVLAVPADWLIRAYIASLLPFFAFMWWLVWRQARVHQSVANVLRHLAGLDGNPELERYNSPSGRMLESASDFDKRVIGVVTPPWMRR